MRNTAALCLKIDQLYCSLESRGMNSLHRTRVLRVAARRAVTLPPLTWMWLSEHRLNYEEWTKDWSSEAVGRNIHRWICSVAYWCRGWIQIRSNTPLQHMHTDAAVSRITETSTVVVAPAVDNCNSLVHTVVVVVVVVVIVRNLAMNQSSSSCDSPPPKLLLLPSTM